MSRSAPTDTANNPSTRWYEWAGGSDGGYLRWYDKDSASNVRVDLPFTFLLLDELSTIKGWHEPSESGIFANEVRDLRQDVLVVKSFKAGELVSGLYRDVRDSIVVKGGHFCSSIYIAYKDADVLRLGNLSLKGAAVSAWMDFKRKAPTVKDASGKPIKSYYVDAVKIAGYEQLKNGGTIYRIPQFSLVPVSEDTNLQAIALDGELQSYLADYLKRPKSEAASQASENCDAHDDDMPSSNKKSAFDDFKDDIPF